MKQSRLLILPMIGLSLFSIGTYASIDFNRKAHAGFHKYFYWSSIRLDSDPRNRHSQPLASCDPNRSDCPSWEPETIWVESGLVAKVLILSAFPAFIVGGVVVHSLARLGVSEVTSFMSLVPLLIFAWYYFAAWVTFRGVARFRRRFSPRHVAKHSVR